MPAPLKVANDKLIASYQRTGSVWAVADEVGLCGQSVHERLTRLGIITERNIFTKADEAQLILEYKSYADRGNLKVLAKRMGRTKPFLARQARLLGLTDQRRSKPYIMESAKWRDKLSDAGVRRWHNLTPAQRAEFAATQRSRWQAGWRTINGRRIYFRSKWEANYARYLEWLRAKGEIEAWDHEPETFWFLKIKRGTRSYLPDFRVVERGGRKVYHEVKGWMDAKSRIKLERMAKYHPAIVIILVDKKSYLAIAKAVSRLVPEWE